MENNIKQDVICEQFENENVSHFGSNSYVIRIICEGHQLYK